MAGDVERLWLEVALRESSQSGKDAIIRGIMEVKNAASEAAKAGEGLGSVASEAGKAGSAIADIGKTAIGVFTGIKINDVVNQFVDFHKSTMDSVAGLVPLASRLKVTTDELQGYQGAAREANVTNEELNKTLFTFNQALGQAGQGSKPHIEAFEKLGVKIVDANGQLRPMPATLQEVARSLLTIENGSTRAALGAQLLSEKGARLNPLLRELSVPIGDLVDRGKSFGQIVDQEVAEKLDRAKNSSDAAGQQLRALYATVAAPIQATALDFIAGRIATIVAGLKTAAADSERLFLAWQDKRNTEMLQSMATGKPVTLTPGESEAIERERLQKSLDAATARRIPRNEHQQELRQKAIDDAQAALDAFNRNATALRKTVEMPAMVNDLMNGGLPAQNAPKTAGASNPKPTGGGSSNRDRIGEAVNQLRLEVDAAQAAYDALGAGSATPLEDLQREVELRKKIADEIAKLGKYDPKDPRVEEIKQLVRAHEELETKTKQRTEAMRNAVEIERRLGDGTAYLKAETQKLNEALDTGRLSYAGYSAAMQEAERKAGDMGRAARGRAGGIDGIIAGAEQAAEEWRRANSEFETGKKLYSEFSQLGDQLASGAIDNVAKLEQALLQMVLKVGLAIAQSELMKLFGLGKGSGLFGGGGGGSWLSGDTGIGGGSWLTGDTGGGFFTDLLGSVGSFFGFAGGGDPPVGVPSIVGEFEPEIIVPKTPSTVLNRAQLQALGVGEGGGGPTVNVYQTVQVGSVVSQAQHERDLAVMAQQTKEAAINGVLEARGTSSSYRRAFSR